MDAVTPGAALGTSCTLYSSGVGTNRTKQHNLQLLPVSPGRGYYWLGVVSFSTCPPFSLSAPLAHSFFIGLTVINIHRPRLDSDSFPRDLMQLPAGLSRSEDSKPLQFISPCRHRDSAPRRVKWLPSVRLTQALTTPPQVQARCWHGPRPEFVSIVRLLTPFIRACLI